ncbi:MAG: Zn-dependent hydrolase [Gammaproteobacteria bacterium]|nr:Zn-dependent hydrolase [Gammaproteobacteria bacterium]MCW8988036.1 Zn-dependent hydrolase [Gammaproteobacteria bacterium]MCW9030159.1 Zn-dependent hydrolase [Gammaproteobacteria bacterium]
MENLNINRERLQADIEALAAIGRGDDYGIYRMAFSDGDIQGRKWFIKKAEEAGLDFYQDGAANLHARYLWDEQKPSVVMGSHIDTVPAAGHLDGALGVVVALECLRCIKEQGLKVNYPLEAIAFSDEEGRFGGMLGSQAIAGMLTPEKIVNASDLDGVSLIDAMQNIGLDAMNALHAKRNPESILAFLELHIEQGPMLDNMGISIGNVDAIAGLFKWDITLTGTANHAGTTPMDMRKDAFMGLSAFASQLQRILDENGSPRSVATIGRVEISPGAANVIPGKVEFSLDARDTNPEVLNDLANAFRKSLSAIARKYELMFDFRVLSEIAPVKSDAGIVETIENVCKSLKVPFLQMASGAAHDTQIMANITRAGMIFVPSKDGRSHSIAEWTDMDDIERGANVALNTLYRIAGGQL